MDAILNGLNEQQKCAVTSPSTALQVLAPPGSGKTKTLTTRVAYLIARQGMKPWNMIVCTFTIKAAKEMKDRIRTFIGDEFESKLVLGTFHSIARRYLSRYGHCIGIAKNFGIADSNDSLAMIKRIVKRHDFNLDPKTAQNRISKRKSRAAVGEEEKVRTKQNTEQQEFESIYEKYEEALKTSNLLDYDDLLLRCVELLKGHPECVTNIEAVLIDEFQDTNHVQYELMSLFAQHRNPKPNRRVPSITIVGDPDQSIYSFRSAEIKNLKKMARQYADTQIVLLEENYRSSGSILLSAVEVIEQDEARPQKKLLATHGRGEKPVLRTLPSAAAEAAWIVAEIQRAIALTGDLFNHADFAILLRSAQLSRPIETALGRAGIAYRMVGGSRFFDRVEIKLLLDYLRVVSQPDSNDALARVINLPARKVGDVTIKSLLEEAESKKQNLWTLVLDAAQGRRRPNTKITPMCQQGLEAFSNIILTSQKKMAEEACTIVDLLKHIMKKIKFEDYVEAKFPEDVEARMANVQELINLASDGSTLQTGDDASEESLVEVEGVEQQVASGPEAVLIKFLANVTLASAVDAKLDDEDAPKQVTISTIHAAKGLEWPVVFIPSAYQGSIPHSRAEDTDEERRLLYVGMTRAKALLYLSWPKKSTASDATTLSPFLSGTRIAPRFTTRGPAYGFEAAKSLARILGRGCPSEELIIDAMLRIQNPKDDYWPEDGEDTGRPENNHFSGSHFSSDWGSNYSSDPLTMESTSGFKRQKLGQTSYSSKSGVNVGMPTPGAYSINNTTVTSGFKPAGLVRREIEEQAAREAAQRSIAESQQPKIAKPAPKTGRGKKQVASQGNILSFFGKPKLSNTSSNPAEKEPPPSLPLLREQNLPPNRPQASLQNPSNQIPTSQKSKSPSIPSTFTTHKPRFTASTRRPPKPAHQEDHESTRYIILSSSPIKAEDSQPPNPEPECPAKENAQQTSMHTTTMARLNQNQGPKRSLGMRQGWSSGNNRVNKPFSAPRPGGGRS
ncbi:UvrD-helicase-domain-containing protein [Venturia nashicola]|nr:UvrD-helicase-domain-containing protein [Venturia nashicola]